MNEFTKLELEEILNGIAWWLDSDSSIYSEKLINKIQSMIDNYCEHVSDGNIDWSNSPTSKCKKCGAFCEQN